MTANVQLLRDAVSFLRDNPSNYAQYTFYYKGKGCVVGRAAFMHPDFTVKDGELFDSSGNYADAKDFTINVLGLNEDDYHEIFRGTATLNSIEQRLNQIEARENPPVAPVVDEAILSINGVRIGTPAHLVDLIVTVARVANPDVSIVKITEEVL